MREFAIQIAVGVGVAVGWAAIWTIALRAFDIPFPGNPEGRASRRERIARMGKRRYILIFGMLGFGLAMGLGTSVAGLVGHNSMDWEGAAIKLVT